MFVRSGDGVFGAEKCWWETGKAFVSWQLSDTQRQEAAAVQ